MQTRSRTKSLEKSQHTKTKLQSPAQTQAPTQCKPQSPSKPKAATPANTEDMGPLTLTSTIRLASGALMPRLGFGVYQARGEECRHAVIDAIGDGYRHIDSAQAYHNEHHVAAGISAASVPRSSLFLTTKFMPGHSVPTEDQVYAHLTKSPPKLSPGDNPYIDLMLIHAPRPNAAARAVHWAALARAQKEGWIRDIGVSNFGVPHLEALPGPTPAVNQVELHPFCQQRDIVEYCRKHGIVVQAYCPLVRAKEARMRDPTLMRVAQKHGKEVAQVLLKWSLQKGFVPLPKSVTPARILSNTKLYDFELDHEDMAAIDALDEGAAGAVSWNPVNHE